MPEPTEEPAAIRKKIMKNINNLSELSAILKALKGQEEIPMEDRVDLMLLVFTAESKVPKYDLITYLWNFLKILYNNMVNRLMLTPSNHW